MVLLSNEQRKSLALSYEKSREREQGEHKHNFIRCQCAKLPGLKQWWICETGPEGQRSNIFFVLVVALQTTIL